MKQKILFILALFTLVFSKIYPFSNQKNKAHEKSCETYALQVDKKEFSFAHQIRGETPPNSSCKIKIELTGIQGGAFKWDEKSTKKENGIGKNRGAGTIIKPYKHIGAGRWIRNFSNKEVNVLWFGDAGENDSALFQMAHDALEKGNILAPPVPSGYFFTSTVKISNNHHFIGDETVIKSKPNKAKLLNGKDGYYPTTLFTNRDHIKGNLNLSLNGFIFDGNDQNYIIGKAKNKSGVASLLEFIRVRDLNLDNNHIKYFYSNSWSFKSIKGLTEEEQRGYRAAELRWCENVSIRDFSITDSRREGLELWRSKNVYIDNFYSNNHRLCTPISAWLSDNVIIENAFIDERNTTAQCSTINWLVKNSHIRKSKILGGRGIDIGNEVQKPFINENNTIENNTITGGIYIIGRNELKIKNLIIKNNKFISTAVENKYVIQLASLDGVTIENNTIDVNGYRSGIYLQGSHLYPMGISNVKIQRNTIKNGDNGILIKVGTKLKNIRINNNFIHGNTAIFFDVRDNGTLQKAYIYKNNLMSEGKYNKFSLRNVGIGFRYNKKLNTGDSGEINGVEIRNNTIHSPKGKCILLHQKSTPRKVFKNITKSNNNCL